MAEEKKFKIGDLVFVHEGAVKYGAESGHGTIVGYCGSGSGGYDVSMDDSGESWYVDEGHIEPLPVATVVRTPATDKTEAQIRKERPVARGVLDYFPDAIMAVAELSRIGNEQHNPGQPMHWAREKSTDHADCIVRHLIDRDTVDTDGVRHSAKVAWRALALLQTELEAADPELKARRGGK